MSLVLTLPLVQQVVLPNGGETEVDNIKFHSILFGGDQLTVARIRGANVLRDTYNTPTDRFEGLLPVVKDWHARMALLKVSLFDNKYYFTYYINKCR